MVSLEVKSFLNGAKSKSYTYYIHSKDDKKHPLCFMTSVCKKKIKWKLSLIHIFGFANYFQLFPQMYEHEHNKKMSTTAVAAMLSIMLYSRRFFPFYVYNIVAGLDEEGKGCVFSFDPVGSYERETYRAGGSASAMLQPLLDNQIGFKNQHGVTKTPLSQEKAIKLVKDVFISAAERDIYTGDAIVLNLITKDGVKVETFPLRRD
ncbi:proteasome subunit beta type-1-B-like [Mytilus galloprovincialis]|uniref:proteasome subunit beta type-1-B-like n=1 Tax=Mytilus galloprovincialis TaxID=29158 RepID=UPI003F7B4039